MNEGDGAAYEILNKTYLGDLFPAGGGGVYRLRRWHRSTCLICGVTVFFSVDMHATLSACVCVRACVGSSGLKDTRPSTRFSRLRAASGSKPYGPLVQTLPSSPPRKNNSGLALVTAAAMWSEERIHALVSSLPSPLRCRGDHHPAEFLTTVTCFPCCCPPALTSKRRSTGDNGRPSVLEQFGAKRYCTSECL